MLPLSDMCGGTPEHSARWFQQFLVVVGGWKHEHGISEKPNMSIISWLVAAASPLLGFSEYVVAARIRHGIME